MFKLLLDAQLPDTLADMLREASYNAKHVKELGIEKSKDRQIWEYAMLHKYAIMTKDKDFRDWILVRSEGPIIIWLRIGNCSNLVLINWLIPMMPRVVEAVENGEKLIDLVS